MNISSSRTFIAVTDRKIDRNNVLSSCNNYYIFAAVFAKIQCNIQQCKKKKKTYSKETKKEEERGKKLPGVVHIKC